METLQNDLNFHPPADKALFRKHIQRELKEIRQEAAEAYV